jgi:hypothetical protein
VIQSWIGEPVHSMGWEDGGEDGTRGWEDDGGVARSLTGECRCCLRGDAKNVCEAVR